MSVSHAITRRSTGRRRRFGAAVAAAILLGAAYGVTSPVSTPAAATPAAPASDGNEDMRDEMTILAEASSEAVRTGAPVEVVGKRTEVSRLLANPSGSFTTESFAQPVHVKRGQSWVEVDPRLRTNPDGTISPAATPGGLTISGGGTGPLVTVSKGDHSLSIGWPSPLPAPTLSGDTATYRDVLPDVDLEVIADPEGGYRERLVVGSPSAAAHPALREISFSVHTTRLTLAARPDGGVNAVDTTGTAVFATDTPLMWDTPTVPALSRIERMEGNPATDQDPQPTHVAPMEVRLTGETLTVIPDQDLLRNPAVTWPVYIDPSSTPISSHDWTHISRSHPTQSYWNYDRADGAKVGRGGDGVNYRSYFLFGIAGIRGKIVTKATFAITLNHSWSCTGTPVQLYRTSNISRSASVTWKNSVTDTNKWLTHLATASGHANETSCGQDDMPMDFASSTLTSNVQTAANGTSNQLTLGLRAPDENNTEQWKKFRPNTAKLTVEWNTAPAIPTDLTTYPPTVCGGSASPVRLPESMRAPTFTAGLSDADANNLAGHLEIRRASDNGLAYGPAASATIPAGGVITWPTLPATALALNTAYYYQARARDTGGAYGAYTGRCYFLVDGQDPGVPTVTSTDFPNGAEGVPTGEIGTVTIAAAAGDTDIVGYRYGFDDNVELWAPANSTGTATVPITLWGDPGFPGMAAADLWVKAVDHAGNERPDATGPRALTANDTAATVAGTRGDINGDGTADVTTILDMGNGRTAAWNFLSDGSGFHPPTIGWDSGTASGHPIDAIKTTTGDFDNDGRTDSAMFRQDPDGTVRLVNLRSDTNQYRYDWAPIDAGTWKLSDSRVLAGDFTGDGIDDVAAVVDDRAGGWKAYVYPSTGSVFTTSGAPWYTQNSGTYTWINTKMVAGDFTGDGRTDLAVAQDTTGSRTTLRLHTSTGTALTAASLWWDSDTDTNPATFTGTAAKYAIADVTGSDADDIIALYNHGARSTIEVLAAGTGTFTAPQTWWDSDTGSEDGWEWRQTQHLVAGDFDNDGDPDLAAIVACCEPGNRELWSFPHNGTSFGPVTKRGDASATTVKPTTAHWQVDEGTGTILTDLDGASPATLSGPTWNNSGHIIGTKALQFDGTNDYATPSRAIVDTTRSFTAAAWVKIDDVDDYQTILSQDGTHRSSFYLQYGAGTWRFVVASADSAGSVDYYAARHHSPPRVGVWTHLTAVFDADANQLKLYVNGALTGAATRPTSWTATGPLQIGRANNNSSGSSNWRDGAANDIRVYDDALTPTDVGEIVHRATPAGHWKLDTTTGPTTDATGNNRNLTLQGATTGTPGKYGEALTLNGTTNHATAANSIDAGVGYTVCGWAKLNTGVDLTYRAIVSQDATQSSGFWLRTSPNDKWQFTTANTNSIYTSVNSTTNATANTWQHVCGAFDAGTSQLLIYINGKLEGAAVTTMTTVLATGPVNIGRYKYLNNYGGNFPGALDDIRLYSGAILDPRQITAIMNDN